MPWPIPIRIGRFGQSVSAESAGNGHGRFQSGSADPDPDRPILQSMAPGSAEIGRNLPGLVEIDSGSATIGWDQAEKLGFCSISLIEVQLKFDITSLYLFKHNGKLWCG